VQELISEAASDAVQTIMALGHNKGWEEAASALSVSMLCLFRLVMHSPKSLSGAQADNCHPDSSGNIGCRPESKMLRGKDRTLR
jgi:hypothetical protein